MSVAIHRMEVQPGKVFKAPVKLGFGWQESRRAFSVWYRSGDESRLSYMILGTGHEYERMFHAFHLCEVLP